MIRISQKQRRCSITCGHLTSPEVMLSGTITADSNRLRATISRWLNPMRVMQDMPAFHCGGHDQGGFGYTQMAGNITPLIEHQQPITPDQRLAETGAEHGITNVDHALQPVQHDAAAAAQMPAMEMPTETDHGHHG
jgi:hypothetical protein